MNLPQRRILYVDDNTDDQELLGLMLREAKTGAYEMTNARTVAEGIKRAQAGQYDLIVLDHYYEDGSSLSLCEQIRALDQQTPIIFFTADVRNSSRTAAFAAGAQAYLVKPNDLPVLVETIERFAQQVERDTA
jgi:two-component system, OmpR family, alkaline phosphatase synthesis response regulator PhoP